MDFYQELAKEERNRDCLSDYKICDFLGKGGFAHVFRAEKLLDGSQVAIKIYSKEGKKSSLSRNESLRKESELYRMLKHPNIVQFIEFKESSSHIFIVLEYCNGGDLWKYVKKRNQKYPENPLDPKSIATMTKQIVKAVNHLHGRRMVHRDLKPGKQDLTFREHSRQS